MVVGGGLRFDYGKDSCIVCCDECHEGRGGVSDCCARIQDEFDRVLDGGLGGQAYERPLGRQEWE